jgi:hypothetical protein
MARYIDADRLSFYFNALAEHAEIEGLLNMAHVHRRCLQMIEDEPTADVVPKSEVEKIFEEIEDALSENFHADCQMGDVIEDYYDDNLRDAIAELKKKYTEGTNEN